MVSVRRMLQIVRFAMLFSIVIYSLLIAELPSTAHGEPVVYYGIVFIAIGIVIVLFVFHGKFVKNSEAALASNPADGAALKRWQTGYIVTYAFSESLAAYGLLLHFLGFGFKQVAPFLIAGFLLIVFYSPKLPVSSQP